MVRLRCGLRLSGNGSTYATITFNSISECKFSDDFRGLEHQSRSSTSCYEQGFEQNRGLCKFSFAKKNPKGETWWSRNKAPKYCLEVRTENPKNTWSTINIEKTADRSFKFYSVWLQLLDVCGHNTKIRRVTRQTTHLLAEPFWYANF